MRDSTSKPWRTSEGTQVGEGHWMGEHDRERLICLIKPITSHMWSESMDQHLQIFRGMPIWIVLFLLRKRTRSNCSNSDVKSFVSNSLPLTLILFIFLSGSSSSSSLHHCSGVRSEEEKLCSCASAVTKAAPELVIFLARGSS